MRSAFKAMKALDNCVHDDVVYHVEPSKNLLKQFQELQMMENTQGSDLSALVVSSPVAGATSAATTVNTNSHRVPPSGDHTKTMRMTSAMSGHSASNNSCNSQGTNNREKMHSRAVPPISGKYPVPPQQYPSISNYTTSYNNGYPNNYAGSNYTNGYNNNFKVSTPGIYGVAPPVIGGNSMVQNLGGLMPPALLESDYFSNAPMYANKMPGSADSFGPVGGYGLNPMNTLNPYTNTNMYNYYDGNAYNGDNRNHNGKTANSYQRKQNTLPQSYQNDKYDGNQRQQGPAFNSTPAENMLHYAKSKTAINSHNSNGDSSNRSPSGLNRSKSTNNSATELVRALDTATLVGVSNNEPVEGRYAHESPRDYFLGTGSSFSSNFNTARSINSNDGSSDGSKDKQGISPRPTVSYTVPPPGIRISNNNTVFDSSGSPFTNTYSDNSSPVFPEQNYSNLSTARSEATNNTGNTTVSRSFSTRNNSHSNSSSSLKNHDMDLMQLKLSDLNVREQQQQQQH